MANRPTSEVDACNAVYTEQAKYRGRIAMDDGIRPIDENGASELVFERVELGEERDLEERPLKSKVINAGVLVVAALISLLLLAAIDVFGHVRDAG